jgi:molybdate transport system substrate-binding protein
MKTINGVRSTLLGLLLSALAFYAAADEIRVISGGAARAFVEPMARSFQGHEVKLEWQPMGKLVQSVAAGQPADLLIVTSEVLEQLEKERRVAPGSGQPIARVGIGVAVHESAPSPDISTPDAFKRTLLAAQSIIYVDPKTGTSGKHLLEVFQRLGIADQVKDKTRLLPGGYVVEPVGRGEVELGIHQISEILPVKGVKLVGELPRELQKYTVYVAVPSPSTARAAQVQQLIQHLRGTSARERLAQAGYTAPE